MVTDKIIQGACGPNVGGVTSLELIRVQDIVSIPSSQGPIVSEAIGLVDNATYYRIHSTEEGVSASSSLKLSENGAAYDMAIAVSMGQDNTELMQFCAENQRQLFVAIVTDANGLCKLYGTKLQPLALSFENTTGRLGSDQSDRPLRLAGRQRNMPALYQPPSYLVAGATVTEYFITSNSEKIPVNA